MTLDRTLSALIAAIFLGLAIPSCTPDSQPEPTNRVVIIVDASGSYRNRWEAALEVVLRMLDEMAQTKVKRWETASDRIVLVSLDALPGVIWDGTLQELKANTPEQWAALFAGRGDYRYCTDVAAAFRVAAKHLKGDPRYVHKRLLVFSDLIDEPPTTSIAKCSPPQKPSPPPEHFPWDVLGDTQTWMYWLPPNQKFTWERALLEHGLEDASVVLYAVSDSAANAERFAVAPPRATIVETDEERAEKKQMLLSYAVWAAEGVGVAVLAPICGIGLVIAFKRRRARSRRNSSADAEGPPQARTGG